MQLQPLRAKQTPGTAPDCSARAIPSEQPPESHLTETFDSLAYTMFARCGPTVQPLFDSPLPLPLLSLCLPSYSCKQALVPNIMGYGAKGLPMGGLQRNIFSQPEKRLTSRQRPPPLLVLRKDGALADDTGDRWDLAREETRAAAWGARRRQAHAPLPARPSRGGELSRLAQAPGAGVDNTHSGFCSIKNHCMLRGCAACAAQEGRKWFEIGVRTVEG